MTGKLNSSLNPCRQRLRRILACTVVVASPWTFSATCPPSGFPGEIATIALIQKKEGISIEDFRSYWRDIHGTLAVL